MARFGVWLPQSPAHCLLKLRFAILNQYIAALALEGVSIAYLNIPLMGVKTAAKDVAIMSADC